MAACFLRRWWTLVPAARKHSLPNYTNRDGDGQVTLLMYPTPQLAAARLRDIDAFLKAGNTQNTWPQPLAESRPGSVLTRSSGPIVAVVSGSLPEATAHKLISQVNYQADVVWNNPQGYIGDGSKVARLLIGIFALTGISGGRCAAAGPIPRWRPRCLPEASRQARLRLPGRNRVHPPQPRGLALGEWGWGCGAVGGYPFSGANSFAKG